MCVCACLYALLSCCKLKFLHFSSSHSLCLHTDTHACTFNDYILNPILLSLSLSDASGNRFDKFPKQFLRCENLVSLNLHNNSLRAIPEEITKLCELKELYVR